MSVTVSPSSKTVTRAAKSKKLRDVFNALPDALLLIEDLGSGRLRLKPGTSSGTCQLKSVSVNLWRIITTDLCFSNAWLSAKGLLGSIAEGGRTVTRVTLAGNPDNADSDFRPLFKKCSGYGGPTFSYLTISK